MKFVTDTSIEVCSRFLSKALGFLRTQDLPDNVHELCQNVKRQVTVPNTTDFFEFLNLKRPDVEWDRLHEFPTHAVL